RVSFVLGFARLALLFVLLFPAHRDAERVVEGSLFADVHREKFIEAWCTSSTSKGASCDCLDKLPVFLDDSLPPCLGEQFILKLTRESLGIEAGFFGFELHLNTLIGHAIEMHVAAVDEDVRRSVDRVSGVESFVELDPYRAFTQVKLHAHALFSSDV